MSTDTDALRKMREPFPPHQISRLPKESRAQIDERKASRSSAINCQVCGSWHHRNAVHLDYVGHAALTDRLLDVDPAWAWEPMSVSADGLPVLDPYGGMWIRLTVCGVTRIGYGHAGDKSGGDAIKEVIGDALRNAAMRFGAALDLWHKGQLHVDDDDATKAGHEPKPEPEPKPIANSMPPEVLADWLSAIATADELDTLRGVTREGMASAKAAGDVAAFERLRKAGNARAEALQQGVTA